MKLAVTLLLMAIVAIAAANPLTNDSLEDHDVMKQPEIHSNENKEELAPQESTEATRIIPIRCVGTLPSGAKYYYKKFKRVPVMLEKND